MTDTPPQWALDVLAEFESCPYAKEKSVPIGGCMKSHQCRCWVGMETALAGYHLGYRAGQEAMRERASLRGDNEARDYEALYVLEGFPEDLKRKAAAQRVAKLIRALPIEDEKTP